MIRRTWSARPCGGGPAAGGPPSSEAGALSLEAVLVLPILALLVGGLLGMVGVVRDVLILHEAARAGARAAATTTGTDPVVRAVRQAAPELPDVRVRVTPTSRRAGDLVRVRVHVDRSLGPVSHRLRASTVARVEPVVGSGTGPGSTAGPGGRVGLGSVPP
jgi:Flp pilus assembly protein TadG